MLRGAISGARGTVFLEALTVLLVQRLSCRWWCGALGILHAHLVAKLITAPGATLAACSAGFSLCLRFRLRLSTPRSFCWSGIKPLCGCALAPAAFALCSLLRALACLHFTVVIRQLGEFLLVLAISAIIMIDRNRISWGLLRPWLDGGADVALVARLLVHDGAQDGLVLDLLQHQLSLRVVPEQTRRHAACFANSRMAAGQVSLTRCGVGQGRTEALADSHLSMPST